MFKEVNKEIVFRFIFDPLLMDENIEIQVLIISFFT